LPEDLAQHVQQLMRRRLGHPAADGALGEIT
jgi:hypothetical protein